LSLATREQGLMFRRAFRGRIRGPADAARLRLRLADRQPNAGTHRLTRRLFAEAAADVRRLPIVGPFASHLEVGLAVRGRLADVGVGVRVAAEMCGLDFLPLHSETFRLAIPGHYLRHARVGGFVRDLLAEFDKAKQRRTPGYSFDALGKMVPLQAGSAGARGT
jgi:molybdate-binding protein